MSEHHEPLIVLESFRTPRPTTNPYITQLARSLSGTPGVDLRLFSYRTAILGRYHVFHVHWPEQLMGGHTWAGRVVRRILTALIALRLLITRTPLVRTWHNLERPSDLARADMLLLDALDRLTTLRIRISEATPDPGNVLTATIPHGHYRDWFADYPTSEPRPNTLAYVGLIRRYKGVEDLVRVFRECTDPQARLLVAGKPSTEELTRTIQDLAHGDSRITLTLEYLDDADLVRAITSAALVVLPYRHMHNSGSVLAALSLSRPVLVPENTANRLLAAEVGPSWIHTYSGDLDAAALQASLTHIDTHRPTGSPNLSGREWSGAGERHAEAFRTALAARRGRRRTRQ